MGGAEAAEVSKVAAVGKESQSLDGGSGSWSAFFLVVTVWRRWDVK